MPQRSLYQQLLAKILPRLVVITVAISAVILLLAYVVAQEQADNQQRRQIAALQDELMVFLENTQGHMANLSQNHLLINSFIDFEYRDNYLPLFIRSLRLTEAPQQTLGLFDFTGRPMVAPYWQKVVPATLRNTWQEATLSQSRPFTAISEDGVLIATPVLINDIAEGAMVLYIPNLQSVIEMPDTASNLLITSPSETILFSNNQTQYPPGTTLDPTPPAWMLQKKVAWRSLVFTSQWSFQHAFTTVYWLLPLLAMVIGSLIFVSMYTARRTAFFAGTTLRGLYDDLEMAAATGEPPKAQHLHNEPLELADIRQAFYSLTRNLLEVSLSNEQFTNVLDSLGEMLLVADERYDTLLSNQRLKRFCQQHNIDESQFAKDLHPHLISTSVTELHYPAQKNEKDMRIAWSAIPLLDSNHNRTGTIYVGEDMTRQRSLESHVKLLNQAIDEATVATVITDIQSHDHPVVYVNQAFQKLTGYRPDEIIGRNCRMLQGSGTSRGNVARIRHAIAKRQPVDVTLLNYRKNGEPFMNRLILTPVSSEGTVTHYIGFQQDVTEQEQATRFLEEARQKAEESVKIKAGFLASMSHEIRTPIHGISGLLQLLSSTSLNGQQKEYLRLATSSTNSLLHIINDILDFSKIEAGQLQVEHAPFDLREELTSITENFRLQCEDKGLAFSVSFKLGQSAAVIGDAVRVRQILTNLLSNALKFTHTGSISVTVILQPVAGEDSPARKLTMEVSDSGVGIDNEKLDTIFEQFVQENMSTSRQYGGTGLGLSITRQLCQLMHGDIEAKSQKGQGSTFTCHLMLKQAISPPIPPRLPHNTSPLAAPKDKLTILVVEDNEINRVIACQHLQQHKTLCAKSGREALNALHNPKVHFDIILMDCQMPVMDGFEATRRIRGGEAGDSYRHIPIIALTANAMKGDRDICLQAGMNDYLSKPFEAEDLHEKIRVWAQPEIPAEAAGISQA
ncbi:ATP-binding protein [Alteromonas sp. ASW11-19]|uniref:histidine kinase n=1 Tax=Alteromonas salexigens TaxID=2982530 RepID=A0ABT2VIZ7_9ALTE|nr:ATP-binding protein [Alteromonas salexigens]MCU7553162.1 ATP-binding protein [Alteromonas salexigens]